MQSKLEEINQVLPLVPEQSKNEIEEILKKCPEENKELFYTKVFSAIKFELTYRQLAKKNPNDVSMQEMDELISYLSDAHKELLKDLISKYSLASIFSKNEEITKTWDSLLMVLRKSLSLDETNFTSKLLAHFQMLHLMCSGGEIINNFNGTVESAKCQQEKLNNIKEHETKTPQITPISTNQQTYAPRTSREPETTKGEAFWWSSVKAVVWTILGVLVGLGACAIVAKLGLVIAPVLLVGWCAGAGFGLSVLKSGLTNILEDAGVAKSSTLWLAGWVTLGAIIGSILGTVVFFPGLGTIHGAVFGALIGVAAAVVSGLGLKFATWIYETCLKPEVVESPVPQDEVSIKKQMPELGLASRVSSTSTYNQVEQPGSSLPFFADGIINGHPGGDGATPEFRRGR